VTPDVEMPSERESIAIIGMAGRFPGARNVRALWSNLCAGVESIERLSEAQLLAAGATPDLLANSAHVPVAATAEGLDRFDAAFFGVSPRDAELMDPQTRVALETVWEALEDAGVDPGRDGCHGREGRDGTGIGLFMGASLSSYLLHNLLPHPTLIDRAGAERVLLLNDKDFYPTTISYRLDLRGPSLNIGTACSSSLVAVHVACQSLRAGECKIAVAGASSVHVPLGRGYVATRDGIYASDGHCRTFDASASGTVGADGVAFVVLQRQRDAIRHRRQIYALIRGSAVNNDGAAKAGYTAPGVDGQSAVIAAALSNAAVRACEIGYVEAHGTGTTLGDPIEVAALTDAFQKDTGETGYCALGALKANIGHLDSAAGVAGLIKTALAVREGILPPVVNFQQPNKHLDLARSPFFVNTTLRAWPENTGPRKAGVSALGVGGTNVHVIVEEPPAIERRPNDEIPRVFPLSARNDAELAVLRLRLAESLDSTIALDSNIALADVEFTLGGGRKPFDVRRAFVASTREDLRDQLRGHPRATQSEAAEADRVQALNAGASDHVTKPFGAASAQPARLVLLAPPRDAIGARDGRELFVGEPRFRRAVLDCVDAIEDARHADRIRRSFESTAYQTTAFGAVAADTTAIDPAAMDASAIDAGAGHVNVGQTTYLRAFVFQYALARMLSEWGIKSDLLIGLEIGELTDAVTSRSLDLAEALMQAVRFDEEPPAARAMLVRAPHRGLASMLPSGVSIAAVCADDVSVISGPAPAIEWLRPVFRRAGIACRPLRGALSPMGGLGMLRIDDALHVAGRERGVWLELGPGRTLRSLLRWNRLANVTCLPGLTARPRTSELRRVLEWAAAAWEQGVDVEWRQFLEPRGGRVCSLPSYPFQSRRYWIDEPVVASQASNATHNSASARPTLPALPTLTVPPKRADVGTWFYSPVWRPWTVPPSSGTRSKERWVLFRGDDRSADELETALRAAVRELVVVRQYSQYVRLGARDYRIRADAPADHDALVESVLADGTIDGVVHASTLRGMSDGGPLDRLDAEQTGLHGLMSLMQAIGRMNVTDPLRLIIVTNNTQEVAAGDLLRPEQASLKAAAKVIPQEYPNVTCTHVDLDGRTHDGGSARCVMAIVDSATEERFVAWRGADAFRPDFQQIASLPIERVPHLRERGVYLITGGLGGVGSTLAENLAREVQARLILVRRSALPPRSEWDRLTDDPGPDGEAIRRVRRIERCGGEVLVEAADVSDRERMAQLIESAEARFGRIHGVVHAAGLPDTAGVIQRRTREGTECVMSAKVRGTRVLEALLRDRTLDFFVLCSSLATAVYGLKFGEIGYLAANDVLNAYGHVLQPRAARTVTIAWTDWLEVGMSAEALKRARDHGGLSGPRDHLDVAPHVDLVAGMSPSEGVEAFRRALAFDCAEVLVSTQDLHAMLAQQELVLRGGKSGKSGGLTDTAPEPSRQLETIAEERIEDSLRSIWRDLLGVEDIAHDDDFFEIGGDSLVAVRMIARVKETLGVEQSLAAVFEGSTLRQMADAIRTARARLLPTH
jgi:acyl transferase domain-containing protein/acyl carrier protein